MPRGRHNPPECDEKGQSLEKALRLASEYERLKGPISTNARRVKPIDEDAGPEPTLDDLRRARLIVANCIKLDGPAYLPVFQCLDDEVNRRATKGILPSPLKQLLTSREAADILRVGEKALRYLSQRGEIPFILVGVRFKRYHPDDIQAYIDRKRVCAPSPEEMKALRRTETGRPSGMQKYDFQDLRRSMRNGK